MKKSEIKNKFTLKSIVTSFKTRSFKVGGYSVFAAIIVLAIAIVLNLLASALPTKYTQFDTSSQQLFTISDQTEKILASLKEDVTVYWIAQDGYEDDTLGTLLERYKSLSDKISVVQKDPDVSPTFLQSYDVSTVYNNSLVVESGERYRYVDYYDIFEYDYSNYYYNYSYTVDFAGESAITSAISYVVSEDLPKIYTLTGHGESELSSSFSDSVKKENVELEEISLLTIETVPEDADAILIYAPQSDISIEEKDIILEYLKAGGNMILITQPPEDSELTNLNALMAEYGVTANEGIVVEGNSSNYAMRTPYYLLPSISYHTITSPLQNNGYYVLLPVAQGLSVSSELPDGVSVSQLLKTSSDAFSKIDGYKLDTYEKEDGDIEGPFALAVAITDSNADSQIVWVSSAALLDEQTNLKVSGGNQDFFLNSINWMCEQENSISIHSKSLDYEYLTIDSGTASLMTAVIIGILPASLIVTGIFIWVRRKRA